MIKVNQNAKKEAIQKAYNDAIEQAKAAAERGQEYVTVNYWAPGYSEGSDVNSMLREQGVVCQERGFGSYLRRDGSYDFSVRCRIVN